jgi:hypothetical protein
VCHTQHHGRLASRCWPRQLTDACPAFLFSSFFFSSSSRGTDSSHKRAHYPAVLFSHDQRTRHESPQRTGPMSSSSSSCFYLPTSGGMAVVGFVVGVGPTVTTTTQRFRYAQPDEVIATTFAKAALLVHIFYYERYSRSVSAISSRAGDALIFPRSVNTIRGQGDSHLVILAWWQ